MTITNPDSLLHEELAEAEPPPPADELADAADLPFDVTQLYLHQIGLNRLLAPEEELHYARRVARGDFAARQKIDLEAARKEVARRMAAQLPDAEKVKAANFVIDNSGSLDQTRQQVKAVWEKLRADA